MSKVTFECHGSNFKKIHNTFQATAVQRPANSKNSFFLARYKIAESRRTSEQKNALLC